MKHSRPEDLFRAEKERALTARNSQHARLLAEAKAAFDKLMAEGQAARKSGRPRKHPLPPLKTSSSRPVAKPAAPPAPPKAAAPAKPSVAQITPAPAAAKPATKPAAVGAAAKRAQPAKKIAKSQSRAARPSTSRPKSTSKRPRR